MGCTYLIVFALGLNSAFEYDLIWNVIINMGYVGTVLHPVDFSQVGKHFYLWLLQNPDTGHLFQVLTALLPELCC